MTIEWNFILRIFVAGILGGLIGFEREFRAKEAGVRTHFIVALGSALFMVISQYAFAGRFDAARVAAQVVSGIGFIGAGVIIFQKNVIRGITTAAGLWVAAAIGLGCGAEISVTLSPVTNDELLEVMKTLKAAGADVTAFTLSDGEASLDLKIKQKDYATTVDTVLSFSKGLKVEIS